MLTERGQEKVAMVFDYLLADEAPTSTTAPGAHLLDGDEAAYRRMVRELRGARRDRRAPGLGGGRAGRRSGRGSTTSRR